MTDQQETPPTHCFMCGHPITSHDPNPDGTRPCRSPGHPNGVPCSDCRAMLTSEYRERVQEERDRAGFETAWNAYQLTLQDARNAFGEHAPVFFTDIHQSALASAFIAYRGHEEQADRLICPGPNCGEDITDYSEDDHVTRTGDDRPYCSGECVVATHRTVSERVPLADQAAILLDMAGQLRRTPRDSRDFTGALRGARLIEEEVKRRTSPATEATDTERTSP